MATIIDGKRISADIRVELAEKTKAFEAAYGTVPGLAVIIVGEDPASRVYVRNKHKACAEVGFYSEVHVPSSSMPLSVTVPGVTIRTISRSTSPFACDGSCVCSQMATL